MQLTNILASSLVGLLGLATISTALPTESTHRYGESTKPRYGACKNPAIRKEWSVLPTHLLQWIILRAPVPPANTVTPLSGVLSQHTSRMTTSAPSSA